jgi:hypothetical protein
VIPPHWILFGLLAFLASLRAGYIAGKGGDPGGLLVGAFAVPLVWLLYVGLRLDHALLILSLGAVTAPAGYRVGKRLARRRMREGERMTSQCRP